MEHQGLQLVARAHIRDENFLALVRLLKSEYQVNQCTGCVISARHDLCDL